MLQNFAGIFLVFIASTSSSVGMNFQKLAHRQTLYEDPRTCNKVRRKPRKDYVMLRPFMLLGLTMSVCAMICDAIALLFIGTTTIGILGTMSIPINVFVSRFLLFEQIKTSEKWYILVITLGCVACLFTAQTHEPLETFERFAQKETAIFIICMWCLAGLLFIMCHLIDRVGFQLASLSVISGIMGSQFVTMGKYLLDMTWLLANKMPLPPTLQIVGVSCLAVMALVLQIIFLNKSLEKFNATHAVAIFQCTWCVMNVAQGIIIFGDMASASTVDYVIFLLGFGTTLFGVIALSRQIGVEPHSYSDHNPSSTGS
jgi:magnesium transporter